MEIEGQRGRVGLPARLGRLPALQPQADRVGAARGWPGCGLRAREPGGARAARRRDRGEPGSARAGSTATAATARPTASATPTATSSSSTTRCERYDAARAPAPVAEEPAAALHRPRRRGQAARPRQRARRRRAREPRVRHRRRSATASTSASSSTTAREAGAWLSASIAAHELIYTRDAYGARGRLHHLAFWVDTREECLRAADLFLDNDIHIEAAPSKHAIAQGFFLYGDRARRQPHRGHDRRLLRLRPRAADGRLDRGRARAAARRGACKTVESFHTYGTPPVDRETSR